MSRHYFVTVNEPLLKEALGNGARLENSIVFDGIPEDGELLGAANLGRKLILEFLVDGEEGDPVYLTSRTKQRVPCF